MAIDGKTLMGWGYQPGPWFRNAIERAAELEAAGVDPTEIRNQVALMAPRERQPRSLRAAGDLAHHMNIRAADAAEADNVAKVEATMRELMRVPTVVAGAVMPDACPAGPLGTIPVGGVIAADNAIHPGMHSADICCSMAISVFGDVDPKAVLDAGMQRSHFGAGGRPRGRQLRPPDAVMEAFHRDSFLKPLTAPAVEHFATQGDGNHFFYVGRLASTGATALVTHHGSRKPGALLYKAGMEAAARHTARLSPETPRANAWIEADSHEGEAYWAALQAIRAWTRASHFAIHDLVAEAIGARVHDRFWNEHNFVFRKTDGRFYHAKGATPAYAGFAEDSNGLTLIPLSMADPVLITRGLDAANGLGFAPHGAGRNMSRTQHLRGIGGRPASDVVAAETAGLDVRFFGGIPDLSELPSAYKNAANVRAQIAEFGLAEVVDTIEPYGSIMAGNTPQLWRTKKQPRIDTDEEGA